MIYGKYYKFRDFSDTRKINETGKILFIPNMDLFFSEYNFQKEFTRRENHLCGLIV